MDQEIRAVCVDFENIDDTEAFYRFLIEMMPKFRADGIKVFVKYQSMLNKERLNSIVDYVIE
jgi:DNA-directed RNA polymerase subunit F